MTPAQLKSSILQLAIQGKLVPQIPAEGTGEELYQQIQKEKQALIKSGKIKKEKPLPPIAEDEIPFEIPEGWRWCRLGEIGNWGAGATPSRTNSEYYNGNIPWLKTGDLNDGYIVEVPEHISNLALEKTSVRLNPIGSVLIAMYGATIGKLGILSVPMTTNQACCACIPFCGIYNKYLFYHLMSNRRNYIKMGEGGAQPNISKEKIINSIFPLPPLAEQRRIVAKIEALMPLIDRYDKAWTQLEAIQKKFPGDLKKSILQMAIQGKLVPQIPAEGTGEELYQQIQKEKQAPIKSGKIKKEKPLPPIAEDEIPFEIPEGWRWCRFLSIVDIATNLVQPQDYSNYMHIAPDNIEKGTGKLFNCKSVGDDKVVSANHLFKKGQVIYSKIRPLLRKAVIAPFDGLCSADMYPLNTTISGDYLLYYILSDGFANQVANAMSSRVKMPKINQDELGKVLIPLPPLAEQRRIVAKIEELMPLCDRLIRN